MRTRIYVAAPLAISGQARMVADIVRRDGLEVVSSWHDTVPRDARDPLEGEQRRAIVSALTLELLQADVLIALTHQGRPRGTYVEIGYALALTRPVIWLVPADDYERCIFDDHPLVMRVRSFPEIFQALGSFVADRLRVPA